MNTAPKLPHTMTVAKARYVDLLRGEQTLRNLDELNRMEYTGEQNAVMEQALVRQITQDNYVAEKTTDETGRVVWVLYPTEQRLTDLIALQRGGV